MKRSLTIVEGPDGAGKSTLINRLAEYYSRVADVSVYHHGPYPGELNIAKHYLFSMLNPHPAPSRSSHVIIMDRAWQSEYVYGPIFRGGIRISTAEHRILTRTALGLDARVITLRPPEHVCVKNITGRAKDAYLTDDEKGFHAVYNGYGVGQHSAQISADGLRHTPYDYTTDPDAVNLKKRLAMPTPKWEPNIGPGYGSYRQKSVILVVGDKPGKSHEDEATNLNPPAFSGLKKNGCSVWLTDRLQEAGIRETDTYWINASNRDGATTPSASWLRDLQPLGIVALGRAAKTWVKNALPNLFETQFISVDHPSFARRFHTGENAFYHLAEIWGDSIAAMKSYSWE